MNARAQLPDLSHLWMPFTANKQFKRNRACWPAPRACTSADGRQILDGTAGLWCVNAGHCREEIVSAIARQAGEMDYAPGFQLGHPLAFEAATPSPPDAGRPGPRVLHQRLRIGGHRSRSPWLPPRRGEGQRTC